MRTVAARLGFRGTHEMRSLRIFVYVVCSLFHTNVYNFGLATPVFVGYALYAYRCGAVSGFAQRMKCVPYRSCFVFDDRAKNGYTFVLGEQPSQFLLIFLVEVFENSVSLNFIS